MGWSVGGLDNLSIGNLANLSHAMQHPQFQFIRMDLLELDAVEQAIGDCDLIFHLAADPKYALVPKILTCILSRIL